MSPKRKHATASEGYIDYVSDSPNRVWFYTKEEADGNSAFSFRSDEEATGLLARKTETTDVFHVDTIDQATHIMRKYLANSLELIAYGGHGNGLRVKWGDGSCHNADGADNNACGFYQNQKGIQHLSVAVTKLKPGGAIHLDACFAASVIHLDKDGGIMVGGMQFALGGHLASWVAYQAPQGSFVLASTDCFQQSDVTIDAHDSWKSSSITGLTISPGKNTLRVIPGSSGCANDPWNMPDFLLRLVPHYLRHDKPLDCDTAFLFFGEAVCEDDAEDACCFCGGGSRS